MKQRKELQKVKKVVYFMNKPLISKKFPKGFRYVDLALLSIDAPPSEGLRISEMTNRIGLYTLLKNSKEKERVPFTKKEIDILLPLVKAMKWTIISEELINFLTHLEDIKQQF
jgi:hypothetical protein